MTDTSRTISWDEWVPESRMLKFSEENLARQKALVAAQKAEAQRLRELANPNLTAPAASSSSSANAGSGAGGAEGGARKITVVKGNKRSREAIEPVSGQQDLH